ncbi:MAG: hypothetical protein ABW032_06390 [Burkholderiaceae bacterium]
MNFWGKLAFAASVAWVCTAAVATTDTSTPAEPGSAARALAGVEASADARYVERWIRAKGDDHGRPFAIVDKKAARIFVFSEGGRLVGSSLTILGLSRGDVPVPGAGRKDPSQLLPDERKTPAGRFESQPGRNLGGEPVVWVDYDTGIAIHRVRPGRSQTQRLHSLATGGADGKRLSLGCVVVPETFFTSVVLPVLGHSRGVVYVLPEDGAVGAMFGDGGRYAAAEPAEKVDISSVR